MERMLTRRQAAKRLGITVPALKDLEASGLAVPVRDEKRRIRYLPEAVEPLRAHLAPTTPAGQRPVPPPVASAIAVAPPPPMPAPVRVACAPTPPSAPPPVGVREIEHFSSRLRELLAQEAARHGMTPSAWVDAWLRAGQIPPLPEPVVMLVAVMASALGQSAAEFWSGIWSAMTAEIQSPSPSLQTSGSAVQWRSPAPPMQPGSAPAYSSQLYAQATTAQPAYRPAGAYPTPIGYGSYYHGQPLQTGPDPVRDARNSLEVQRMEIERRRLERLAADEEEARRRAGDQETIRAAELERARTLALAQARNEQQRREQIEAQQRQEAGRAAAAQLEAARQAAERERQQREEAERVDRAVTAIVAQIPPFVPPEVVEATRQQVWAAIQGRSPAVAETLARDVVHRAVAPYAAEQERLRAREQIAEAVVGIERGGYIMLGPDAEAAAADAVRRFLDAGGADGLGYAAAVTEARRIRDAALAPHREADARRQMARQVEMSLQLNRVNAARRARQLLEAAGVENATANADAIADRAAEIAKVRAEQIDPSIGSFLVGQRVVELLMAAVEEVAREGAAR